jgi:Fe-coproporphyrin III synthase
MKVSVIIINFKTKETTSEAVDKFLRKLDLKTEIILIDNSSADGSVEYFRGKYGSSENVVLIANDSNLGFAKAANQGMKIAQGEYILLLNSDVFIKDNFIKMLEYAKSNPEIGAIGPRMVYGDDSLQYSFGRFPGVINEFCRLFLLYKILPFGTVSIDNFFNRKKFKQISEVDWVTGGCMMISRSALEIGKSLDENYFFGVEDIDFCHRIKKAGKKIIYFPETEVLHLHGFSSGGKRSTFKLKLEKSGLEYYYSKFYPDKKLASALISFFYAVKIKLIEFLENLKKPKAEDVVAAIIYQCNSRCRMCDIWKSSNKNALAPDDFKNMPKSVKDLNISGGEPFLHNNLAGIISAAAVRNSKIKIIISTNGLNPELIREKIKTIKEIKPDLAVAVSLDGGEKIHNEIRGVPGAYQNALKTVQILKEEGIRKLKFSFTLGDYNIRELKKIYLLAKKMGLEFSLTSVHSGPNYFGSNKPLKQLEAIEEALDWLIAEELRGFKIKRWGRAYYAYGLKEFIKTGKRILPDYSGDKNIFIDPNKDIYPSSVSDEKIGSCVNGDLILNGVKKPIESWMVCTARPAIKKHKIRVLLWVLKNKFF